MKCPKCGAEINEGASFCKYCGSPVAQQTTQNVTTQTVNLNNMNNVNMPQNSMPNQYQNGMNMSNQYQSTNNMNMPSQKKTPWGLIIGAIVLAVAIIAVFVGISMSKEDNNSTTNNTNTTEQSENKSDTNENKNSSSQEKSTTAKYDNYTFTIPAGFTAESSSSQLLVTNSNGTLASAIIYQSGTGYDTLASMKDSIISLLEAQETSENYDFTNAVTEEKTYDGTRFLITSGVTQGTIDLDITYAEAPDGVFVVSVAKTNGKVNESDRQTLYSIVASANNTSF